MRTALSATLLSLLAASARADDWPQSRKDAQNSAFIELRAPKGSRPRPWTFEGSGRVYGYEPGLTVWSPPALAEVEGRAVLAVGSYDRSVYALDASTGEVLWKYTTGGPVYSAPVVWRGEEGMVVFASSADRLVYALDAASGKRLWSHSVEAFRPTLGGARLSSPCVGLAGGRPALFVGHWVWDRSLGQSLQRGALTALEPKEGKPLWTLPLGDNELAAPIFASAAGRPLLFVTSSNGNLYAVDPDAGRLLWSHTELDAVRSPAAFVPERAPAVLVASKFGTVRALEPLDGRERWRFKAGDRITGAPSVARIDGRLLVVVPSYDRHLYALDAGNGEVLWRHKAKGGFYSSVAIGGEPRVVLASAWDHMLHAAWARDGQPRFSVFTGRPLWDVSGLDDSNWSSPILGRIQGEEVAFAGGYDGVLRSLPLELPIGAAGERSDLWFWLSFPLALGPLAGLAVWLTRRDRRLRRQAGLRYASGAARGPGGGA